VRTDVEGDAVRVAAREGTVVEALGTVPVGTPVAAPPGGAAPGWGVVAIGPPGAPELVTSRPGRPAWTDGRPAVQPVVVAVADRGEGPFTAHVHGSLDLEGELMPGSEVTASRALRVTGRAERSVLAAARALTLRGSYRECDLRAGLAAAHAARLMGIAGDIDARIVELADETRLLMATAAHRGTAVTADRVLTGLVARRQPTLPAEIEAAATAARAIRRVEPLLPAAVADAMDEAAALLADPGPDGADRLDRAGRLLGLQVAMLATLANPGRSLVERIDQCGLVVAGDLVITEPAVRCEIDVRGELTAIGRHAALRGGAVRVGGVLRANEIGHCTVRSDVRDGLVLTAAVVAAAVELEAAGQLATLPATPGGVRVGVRHGVLVVEPGA
jgi:hypothetical protein